MASKFEEAYFYSMYGAYEAKAADFDGDGDLEGDGDPDIVLGVGYMPAGIPRKALFDRQLRSGPRVLVLKNNRQVEGD